MSRRRTPYVISHYTNVFTALLPIYRPFKTNYQLTFKVKVMPTVLGVFSEMSRSFYLRLSLIGKTRSRPLIAKICL